ncbi:MAG: DNA translocase FtsK [Patescibacteria group bacterium]|jgi:S-DNA-T family DNA segregation ATPase FtsK/SpoIIIE
MPRHYHKKNRAFWNRGGSNRGRYAAPRFNFLDYWRSLSPETKKGIFIIFLFVFAALAILGLFDLSGQIGQVVAYVLSIVFGGAKWLIPALLAALIFFLLYEEKYPISFINYLGALFLIVSLCGLFHLQYDSWQALEMAKLGQGGGYLGALVALPLVRLMSFWGALVVLVALLLVGILLALETSFYGLMWPLKLFKFIFAKLKDWYFYYRLKRNERKLANLAAEEDYEEESMDESVEQEDVDEDEAAGPIDDDNPNFTNKPLTDSGLKDEFTPEAKRRKFGRLDLPLSLLSAKSGKPTSGDIKANQEIIKRTLANFGVAVEMGEVNVGPTVTQYTMRPAAGIKLARLTTLNADLALALAAHPIRIEAPIPGKALVGIEIPNQTAAKVTMGEVLASKEFKERSNNLFLALGKDVSGKPVFADLARMPHLLIAGQTGSGKSVCVNSIIVSLMYQNSPDELKFILIDPKRVEMPVYNNIPYLLTPVVTDVKKTVSALKWLITEMERRFELLAKFGNRNIASYNQTHAEKMPYIVVIIDELADLMASNPNDMEAGIVRLAQMARAVGIHLVLATQRPSTEVITGLIKANIPTRISFAVASSIDSRTILDGTGAEKLVGRGDMLYLGAEFAKAKRIQGVFLSDHEINDVVGYIKKQGSADYVEGLAATGGSFGSNGGNNGFASDDEPLLGEAVEVIKQNGKASASLLQRRLKLGYARAARILDLLEERGVIGPADGAKPREVFLDKLGGADPVEFAAREHGLTGELRPLDDNPFIEEDSAEAEDEPGFTAFRPPEDDSDELLETDEEIADSAEEDIPSFVEKDLNEPEDNYSAQEERGEKEEELPAAKFAEVEEFESAPQEDKPKKNKEKGITAAESEEIFPEEETVEIPEEVSEETEATAEAAEEAEEMPEESEETAEESEEIKNKKPSEKSSKNYFDDDEWA